MVGGNNGSVSSVSKAASCNKVQGTGSVEGVRMDRAGTQKGVVVDVKRFTTAGGLLSGKS